MAPAAPATHPTGQGRIAILGAGPIGLEAALAALEAGKPFRIYEVAPHPAGNLRRWGHVRLFTPWARNVSPRMRRHLEAAGIEVPQGDACPTGDELCDRLLDRIAALPAIAANLATATQAVAVGRSGLLKHQEIGSDERARRPFRLVLRGPDGDEWTEEAATVLDCTGTYAEANALGDGGVPAPGERSATSRILRHIPDICGEPSSWAGKRILVVGAGHSAQTAIRDLARLAVEHRDTRVTWALQRAAALWEIDPDDPLPERAALTARAAEIAASDEEPIEVVSGVTVDALHPLEDGVAVELRADDGSTARLEVDLVLSLTGYTGDSGLYRQLQVHECYATSAPMKLAAALLGGSADCLAQTSHGADTLVSPEPGFFILGIKSYGRTSSFLMQVGWAQVDEAFSLIAPERAPQGAS